MGDVSRPAQELSRQGIPYEDLGRPRARPRRVSYEVALLIVLAVCATASESLAQNAGVKRSPDKMAPIQIQEIARFDARFDRSGSPFTSLVFSPDGRVLALLADPGDGLGDGLLIEAATGRELARSGRVAISPDRRWLVTRSEDGTERLIETAGGTEAMLIGPFSAHAFSPDGRVLAVTDRNGAITRVIDTATLQEVGSAAHHEEGLLPVYVAEVSSYGGWSTDSSDELSRVVETPNGEVLVHLSTSSTASGSGSPRGSSALSPDGRWRGTVAANTAVLSMYFVRLHETASDRQIAEKVFYGPRPMIAVSPDSSLLAAGGSSTSFLMDTATGAERASFGHATSIAFSPNSRWLAAGGNETRLIDTASGVELTRTDGPVAGVAFSPDGTLLATVGTIGTAETLQTVRLLRVNP